MARIIDISPAAFSGEAVAFDPTAYVNFRTNLDREAYAKQQAAENLYKEQLNIPTKGIRPQDTGYIQGLYNDFQKYYIDNAENISKKKDNGLAYQEYTKKRQQLQSEINRSIGSAALDAENRKLLTNPDIVNRLPVETLEQMKRSFLPLGDENYSSFDASQLNFNPKPFDPAAFNKNIGGLISFDEMITGTKKDPNTLTFTNTLSKTPTNKSLQGVMNYATGVYNNDPSAREFAKSLSSSPEMYLTLNEDFKKVTGRNIQNESDLFSAYALSTAAASTSQKQNITPDFKSRQDYIGRLKLSLEGKSEGEVDDLVYRTLEEALRTGKKSGMNNPFVDITGSVLISEALKSSGKEPLRIDYNPNNDMVTIIYPILDERGNVRFDKKTQLPLVDESGKKQMSKRELYYTMKRKLLNKSDFNKNTDSFDKREAEDILDEILNF